MVFEMHLIFVLFTANANLILLLCIKVLIALISVMISIVSRHIHIVTYKHSTILPEAMCTAVKLSITVPNIFALNLSIVYNSLIIPHCGKLRSHIFSPHKLGIIISPK